MPPFKIGTGDRSVLIDGQIPAFIIGPCVIEDEDFIWNIATQLSRIIQEA